MTEINEIYDVLIIGAGPAGSLLSYLLCELKLKVALIDKANFPRKKVCAGGLPSKVLDILPFDIKPIIEKEISQITLFYKLQKEFTKSYRKPLLYMVNRDKFDAYLVQKARTLGVDFFDKEAVQSLKFEDDFWNITTTSRLLKAKIIVGADGANGFVAKNVGLNPIDILDIGIQVDVPIKQVSRNTALTDRVILDWGSIPDGYGWIFPKKDSLSIGVKGPVKMGKGLKLYLEKMLQHFQLDIKDFVITGHLIPHHISEKPISKEKVLLVGDAAGLVDCWTGEGIFYSLKSAQIAAREIKRFFDGHYKALSNYESAINAEIMPELMTSHHFLNKFNYFSSVAFRVIKKYDYPWDLFCRIMRGDRTFLETKKRLRPDIFFRKLLFKSQRKSFRGN